MNICSEQQGNDKELIKNEQMKTCGLADWALSLTYAIPNTEYRPKPSIEC